MTHRIRVTIDVELERIQGKFASRSEMAEAIIDELEGADPGSIYGIGADADSDYEVVGWDVNSDD